VMLEKLIRTLDKTIWREVETLCLYWFPQPELRLVLLYFH